jgi:hypothetical protein
MKQDWLVSLPAFPTFSTVLILIIIIIIHLNIEVSEATEES